MKIKFKLILSGLLIFILSGCILRKLYNPTEGLGRVFNSDIRSERITGTLLFQSGHLFPDYFFDSITSFEDVLAMINNKDSSTAGVVAAYEIYTSDKIRNKYFVNRDTAIFDDKDTNRILFWVKTVYDLKVDVVDNVVGFKDPEVYFDHDPSVLVCCLDTSKSYRIRKVR